MIFGSKADCIRVNQTFAINKMHLLIGILLNSACTMCKHLIVMRSLLTIDPFSTPPVFNYCEDNRDNNILIMYYYLFCEDPQLT